MVAGGGAILSGWNLCRQCLLFYLPCVPCVILQFPDCCKLLLLPGKFYICSQEMPCRSSPNISWSQACPDACLHLLLLYSLLPDIPIPPPTAMPIWMLCSCCSVILILHTLLYYAFPFLEACILILFWWWVILFVRTSEAPFLPLYLPNLGVT